MVSSTALARTPASIHNLIRKSTLEECYRPHVYLQPNTITQARRATSTTSIDDQTNAGPVRRVRASPNQLVTRSQRIIGKPGRRQRVVSERLKTDSLDKPSSIIIFRDVQERPRSPLSNGDDGHERAKNQPLSVPRAARSERHGISAEEIEDYISGQHLTPEEEEVNTSIDALRPDSSILEQTEFKVLAKTLSEGYTLRQLSRYIMKNLGVFQRPIRKDQDQDWESYRWEPGRAPSVHERSFVFRHGGVMSRAKAVDQILRLIWKITVSTEEQQIGWLEIPLQEWQAALLFDIAHDGIPNYKSIIESRYLLDATGIHFDQSRNAMQITGRRLDAEEITQRLKVALQSVQTFDIGNALLKPMLGRPGWPRKLDGLYRRDDLDHISSLTRSLIRSEGDASLVIYSLSKPEQDTTRRLLLALLDISVPRSFDDTFHLSSLQKEIRWGSSVQKLERVPVPFRSGSIHRRYRKIELVRAVYPTLAAPPNTESPSPNIESHADHADMSTKDVDTLGRAIAKHLGRADACSNGKNYGELQAHEGRMAFSSWTAEFCSILHDGRASTITPKMKRQVSPDQFKSTDAKVEAQLSITHPHAPGLEALAKRLTPVSKIETNGPILCVHMIPAPMSQDEPLSTVTLPYVVVSFRTAASGDLELCQLQHVLDEQIVNVPLPRHAVDLQFKRQLIFSPSRSSFLMDHHLLRLQDMLNKTSREGSGPITADADIIINLPTWLLRNGLNQDQSNPNVDEAERNTIDVPYLLERFELVDERRLHAESKPSTAARSDSAVDVAHMRIPENIHFLYQEVEAGTVCSNYSSLRLLDQPLSRSCEDDAVHDSGDSPGYKDTHVSRQPLLGENVKDTLAASPLQLACTAIHVAGLLTRAQAGTLHKPLRNDEDVD